MPTFQRAATSAAPPEEVWKILYNPARFPQWWAGIETVVTQPPRGGEPTRYTMYQDAYPDFPIPQTLRSSGDGRSIVVSCLVTDLIFEWRLEPVDDGHATKITVQVDIPEAETHRLQGQQDIIERSLGALADLAARV